MVSAQVDSVFLPSPLRYASVSARKIVENDYRLDASAYDFDALKALDLVEKNKNGFTYLWSKDGYVADAFIGPRTKRDYVPKADDSVGFLGSAEMLELNPRAVKFVSGSYKPVYGVDYATVLISRSGTIGNTTFVSKTLSRFCVSEHAIRVVCKRDAGYVYAFLHSETGKTILKSFTFGAVIDEIESEHLRKIPIPNASEEVREKINLLITTSFEKRDESNDLIEKAQGLLYSELRLPPLEKIQPVYYDNDAGFRNFTIRASNLDGRFDASYHLPEITHIITTIRENAKEVIRLGDARLTADIFVGNRFKRVYVEKGKGCVYLNGKSITQLDPNGSSKLYLSFSKHEKQIKQQLELKENMILVSCSGTLGRTVLVPKHWNGWAGTHDLIRIIASDTDIAGYIFCYLNSSIGNKLILRNTYGAVIDHIEPEHMQSLPVPILKNKKAMEEINSLVLKANDLRYEAYIEEQNALDILNTDVLCMTNAKIKFESDV
ncbi:MAG: restriction endonuclease subunit S [Treponema sp.]|nr:restriction endonuclease subunit S [Treponema sp.]